MLTYLATKSDSEKEGQRSFIVMTLDQSMNALFLYLQFSFAEKLYLRCCSIPDRCCRWCITLRIKRWTKRHDLIRGMIMEPFAPNSGSTSVASSPSEASTAISCEV